MFLQYSVLCGNFTVKNIFYFRDGAPQQYKNRNNFINLYYHFEDFGVHHNNIKTEITS